MDVGIIEELLERAKNMPKAPARYVLFLEDASLRVTELESKGAKFKVFVEE